MKDLSPHVLMADAQVALQLRSATDSDTASILSLFQTVFGRERSRARWQWKYHNSPSGPGIVSIVAEDDCVVGCSAFMRMDLNHLGVRVPAGQSCDAMVLARVSGRGQFTALFEMNRSAAEEAGWEALISFPNRRSFPIRAGRLGSRKIAVLRSYSRRLGARRIVGPFADLALKVALRCGHQLRFMADAFRVSHTLEVRVSRSIPADLEQVLHDHREQEVLSVWKDCEFLDWRYVKHPDSTYDIHVLYADQAPCAVAICRVREGAVHICELMHRNHDVRETAMLLGHLSSYYARSRAQILSFLAWDAGFYDAAFNEAGFTAKPFSPLTMVATAFERSAIASLYAFPSNWAVGFGDVDVA